MYNYMVDQIQDIKLHIQNQALPDPFQVITLVLIKTIYEQDQTMYHYLVAKLQIQSQAVTVYYFSLSKVTYQNILVSTDLDPDLDTVQEISQVFSETSNHDPHTSRLQTQTRFFTPLSCDFETDITTPTSRKIVISSNLGPDLSAGFDYGEVIDQGFRGPFLLNSSFRDFEKLTKDEKLAVNCG